MKTNMIQSRSATSPVTIVCASILACLASIDAQDTRIPAVPLGTLNAFPTVVQVGTKPILTWNIIYPSKVGDLVLVNPPGTLIPNQTVYTTVQQVCVAEEGGCFDGVAVVDPVTPDNNGLWGNSPPVMMLCSVQTVVPPAPPVDVRLSLNGGLYKQLFYGTKDDVDPAKRLYVKKIRAGQTIDFGGRYSKNGAWSPFYTTRSSNLQVIALVNGSTIPTNLPLFKQTYLSNCLRPYLDASGKVTIGPMSVLILMELSETNHGDTCFDYQDAVLLVTFSRKHPNNGHGNNLDGVDSSNPGQGHGGPNGMVDPSGGVDDEIR